MPARLHDDLVVPQVIRPHVTERVIVLERIHGARLDADHGVSAERAQRLASDFFRAYVRQVTLAGVYTRIPTAATCCSPTTAGSRCSTSACSARDEETRTTLALLLLAIAQNRAEDVAALLLSLSLTTLSCDEPASFWRTPTARSR